MASSKWDVTPVRQQEGYIFFCEPIHIININEFKEIHLSTNTIIGIWTRFDIGK